MTKLTKTLVDKLAAADRDVWAWDDEVPGFGVRVQPSGRKTYVVRYRNSRAQQRKQTVARCSDMPPDRARDLARKVFSAVAEGRDPMEERHQNRAAPTIEDLRDRYMKEYAEPYKKPRSVHEDERNWRIHVLPWFKGEAIRDITKARVVSMHASLSKTPGTANHCLALLSKAMNLAEDWGWREPGSNPCRRLKKYKMKEIEMILTPEQIHTLTQTVEDMAAAREIPKPLAYLVRLLMLTGCRLNEIMSAERAWVDTQRGLLLLPDSKVGQRRIALSPAALEIIASIPKGKWLIAGREKDDHLRSPHGAWGRIKKRAGLPAALRFHDLRHTAGSLGHAAGLTQKQIQIMLGHKQASTTERYIHGAVDEGARVADALASVITQSWTPPSKPA